MDLDDAHVVTLITQCYDTAKRARQDRRDQNTANWDALGGKFPWLAVKAEGQSREVLPSLAMAHERVSGTLASQLTTFRNWFAADVTTEIRGLGDLGDQLVGALGEGQFLTPDQARAILREALEDLATAGNEPSRRRTIRDAIYGGGKLGLVESEIVWKVTGENTTRMLYETALPQPTGPGVIPLTQSQPVRSVPETTFQLKVELVPFEDFFPDPSPHCLWVIHEVTIHRSQLAALGFDAMRVDELQSALDADAKTAAQARGSVTEDTYGPDRHSLRLREFWGTLIDPATGSVLAENRKAVTCGRILLEPPTPNPCWHGRWPFIRVAPLETPLSNTHKAFFDFACPLFSTECELTNLVIDAGFSAVHGAKALREYMLDNPQDLAQGLVGQTLKIREGFDANVPVLERIDTGALDDETIHVLERISRARQEATATSDLDLGRLPERTVKATEIVEVQESSNTLFDQIATRVEQGVECLLNLCWLTLWQGLDHLPQAKLRRWVGPEAAGILSQMTAAQRFVLMANHVTFQAMGYKENQARVREFQKLTTFFQWLGTSPAFLQAYASKYSLRKPEEIALRALQIDAEELKREADEPPLDPAILQGLAGNPNPADAPELHGATSRLRPPNPDGFRGSQQIN